LLVDREFATEKDANIQSQTPDEEKRTGQMPQLTFRERANLPQADISNSIKTQMGPFHANTIVVSQYFWYPISAGLQNLVNIMLSNHGTTITNYGGFDLGF